MNEPNNNQDALATLIRRNLEQARNQLVDRNLRNRLVNCPLTSKRSKQVRVVDEVPDEIFRALIAQKKELTFAAGRGIQRGDSNEIDSDHTTWVPPDEDPVNDVGIARRHRDNVLQTQLTPEGLQKRLTSLYYESREVEQEQGISVLYLALGFLKWFEDARSEVERFAPLVLLPVELTREGAKDKFKLKIRDEDLYANVSLKIWLAEQHSILLPDCPDTDNWLPSNYFDAARTALAGADRWEVMGSEVLLGFFSFSKFLLWRDLDPKNWPSEDLLVGHRVLRKLLAPGEEHPTQDPPVIPDDKRVDDIYKSADLVYVLDADSSQTHAIQTAIAGRDLVIQGPPGTGKSQTIANIIASTIHGGKSVLFVSEKLAALEVVYQRLKDVGLAALCLELHSRKAAKAQVLSQIRQALNAPAPPTIADALCKRLDEQASFLSSHADRLHRRIAPSNQTPFALLGAICRMQDRGVAIPDFTVPAAVNWSEQQIKQILAALADLSERLVVSGIPARHPWRLTNRDAMNPLDAQRLRERVETLATRSDALATLCKIVWPWVRPSENADLAAFLLRDVPRIADALAIASSRPAEAADVLCSDTLVGGIASLRTHVESAKELSGISSQLSSIFVNAAWARDWTITRLEIAVNGSSLLRLLRSRYRQEIRAFRGMVKSALPGTQKERLEVVDLLMRAQSLRESLRKAGERYEHQLGEIWQALPTGWERLDRVVSWINEASKLEPKLSVRNARLISKTADAKKIGENLRTACAYVYDGIQSVAEMVKLHDAEIVGDLATINTSLGAALSRVTAWRGSVDRFNEYPPVRIGLAYVGGLVDESFERRIFEGSIQPRDLVDRFHLAILEQLWGQCCDRDAELSACDGRILGNRVKQFRELDQERLKAASSEVARKHFDHKPTGSAGEMAIIRNELNKVRRHLATRELLNTAGNAIQQLKPVFLMSPLSVAQYLLPGKMKFDVLLIDEASQVRPEDAIGAAARANQLVVVGDAKQLPPTNFFNRIVDDDGVDDVDEQASTAGPSLGAMESILSLCDAAFSNRRMLDWHYRSQHPALIAVSNRNFYDNKLLLPPTATRGNATDDLGIVFNKTPTGSYDRGRTATNVVEADVVAEAVCSFAKKFPNKSLGVGTFSVAQRDVIRELIEKKRRADPSLDFFFSVGRQDEFFVKNLESIQGDERDVIFISVGYGRDSSNRLTKSFGPINADGGERRLNVLISRARQRCEVFSSLTADDIDVSSRRPGVIALKEFLQFAEKGYFDIPRVTDRTFDSDFEESVADFLRRNGYRVDPQVGMAGFFIDLGVRNPKNDIQYVLGIECDGATYHSSRSARDRDRLRQQILESRGWEIYRIWSTDWFHRRKEQEERLLNAITMACEGSGKKKPDSPPPPPVEPLRPDLANAVAEPVQRNATERYEEATFRVGAASPPFESPDQLLEAVEKIVKIEEPIHTEEIARRVATVWGLDRAGSRIQEATMRSLSRLQTKNRCVLSGNFWTLATGSRMRVRDRSATKSLTLRNAEYLPPDEIRLAAAQVVRESVRIKLDELVREIARRFGFLRTGNELEEAIRTTISNEIGKGLQQQSDGSLMLFEIANN